MPDDRYSVTYEIADLKDFLETLDQDSYLGVEASCNTFAFVDQVKPFVSDIMVLNTFKLKLISMVDKKTDKVDAEKVAKFVKIHHLGGEEIIEPVWVPDEKIRALRSLFSTHKCIKRQINVLKNRIHALFKQNLICLKASNLNSQIGRQKLLNIQLPEFIQIQVPILLTQLEALDNTESQIINNIYLLGENYYDIIEKLTSVKGLSPFTVLALISDIGDISRFKSAKKFSSYLRTTPGIDSSNENVKIKKTSKQGRKLSVELLIQAVVHFRNFHPGLQSWFENKDGKKSRGKLRMAICRKMMTQIYHVWSKMEYHWHRDLANHEMKMKAYDKILEKSREKVA